MKYKERKFIFATKFEVEQTVYLRVRINCMREHVICLRFHAVSPCVHINLWDDKCILPTCTHSMAVSAQHLSTRVQVCNECMQFTCGYTGIIIIIFINSLLNRHLHVI